MRLYVFRDHVARESLTFESIVCKPESKMNKNSNAVQMPIRIFEFGLLPRSDMFLLVVVAVVVALLMFPRISLVNFQFVRYFRVVSFVQNATKLK